MRKVILYMHVSLDGFVATSDGELDWVFGNYDDDLKQWTINLLSQVDTHVLGRVNYEAQAGYWPTATDELAPLVNDSTKVVFSSSLSTLDWQNSRLATGGLAEEITALKQEPGKTIYVSGGAKLAQSVSRLGLVDEYHLVVHPIALGTGLPLFSDRIDLRLLSTKEFETGPVAMVYQRA
jgi:dihydrofolate reductase